VGDGQLSGTPLLQRPLKRGAGALWSAKVWWVALRRGGSFHWPPGFEAILLLVGARLASWLMASALSVAGQVSLRFCLIQLCFHPLSEPATQALELGWNPPPAAFGAQHDALSSRECVSFCDTRIRAALGLCLAERSIHSKGSRKRPGLRRKSVKFRDRVHSSRRD